MASSTYSPERKTLILTSTASAMEFEHHRSSYSSSSSSSSSPKQKPRHSISFSRCFTTYGGGEESLLPSPSPSPSPSLLRTSSTWLRLGRLGRRRRLSSGDFKYDPLSYALNFDEGWIGIYGDDDDGGAPVGSGVAQ